MRSSSICLFQLPHMIRNSKISEYIRLSPRPGFCRLVFLVSAIAAIWVVVVLAPQGLAATGAPTNASAIVHILFPQDTGTAASVDTQKPVLLVLPLKLPGYSGHGEGCKEISGSCQTSCPAPGCDLSAILAWQSPTLAISSLGFALLARSAPNSFLYRRLNRPPIGRLA